MSGGVAYVMEDENFRRMVNLKMVGLYELDAMDLVTLYKYLSRHVEHTGSRIAQRVLEKWPSMIRKFVKVLPHDYREMLDAMDIAEKEGLDGEAKLERAFMLKTGKGK